MTDNRSENMAEEAPQGRFDIRGLMLDPARLTERHGFYYDLLPRLAEWGYNTIWWHFCDDEGFAIKLDRHPELASPYAFDREEIARLVRRAVEVGIDIVPEVESLGHALAITRLPEYEHLLNGNAWGHNAVCPSHPDTIILTEDIIDEIAELFPSRFLHAGLDEAVLEGCPRCEERGRGRPDWWVFAEHAKAVHGMITQRGKRMVMWADAVEKHPDLLEALPKDILLAHWHYRDVPFESITPSVHAGFEVVCVPAMSGDMGMPNAANLRNVSDMTDAARALPDDRCRGMVVCWWESFRILRDTHPLAVAYAGAAMENRKALEPERFSCSFLAEYFGVDDPVAADALLELHRRAPEFTVLKAFYPAHATDLHATLLEASSRDLEEERDAIQRCREALAHAASSVESRREELGAYEIVAWIFEGALRNATDLQAAHESFSAAAGAYEAHRRREYVLDLLESSAESVARIADRIIDIADSAEREWDRTRYPRDGKKDNSSEYMRQRSRRSLVARLIASRRFLNRLRERLERSIVRYRSGGRFPMGV